MIQFTYAEQQSRNCREEQLPCVGSTNPRQTALRQRVDTANLYVQQLRLHSAHKNTMLRLVHYRQPDKLYWSASPCASGHPSHGHNDAHHSAKGTGDTLYHTEPFPAYLYLTHRLEYLSFSIHNHRAATVQKKRPHCATVCHGSPPCCARAAMLRPFPTDTTHTSEFGAEVKREIRQQKRSQEAGDGDGDGNRAQETESVVLQCRPIPLRSFACDSTRLTSSTTRSEALVVGSSVGALVPGCVSQQDSLTEFGCAVSCGL